MNTVKQQFDEMLDRGVIPCLEYQIGNNEYLIVDITATETGLQFTFDQTCQAFFDGEITGIVGSGCYELPYDNHIVTDNKLDQFLELINNNMVEGYLIPNGLYSLTDWE